MKVDTMYPSKYLRGVDLTGPVTVTIANIRKEQVYKPGVGQTDVFVLYCEKASRGVVLSKPLAFSIAEAIGEPDTDGWPGKQVQLFPQPMSVAGRAVVAIRARAVNGKA